MALKPIENRAVCTILNKQIFDVSKLYLAFPFRNRWNWNSNERVVFTTLITSVNDSDGRNRQRILANTALYMEINTD